MDAPTHKPDPDALFFQGGSAPFGAGNEFRPLCPNIRWKSGASYLVGGGFPRPTFAERGAPLPS